MIIVSLNGFVMDRNVCISPRLIEELNQWFRDQPPAEIKSNLRKMLFDYLRTEVSTGIPDYYEDLLIQLDGLFNLLDQAEKDEDSFSSRHPDRSTRIQHLSLGALMNYLADFVNPVFIFVRPLSVPICTHENHYEVSLVLEKGSMDAQVWSALFSQAKSPAARFCVQAWAEDKLALQLAHGDLFLTAVCRSEHMMYNPQGLDLPKVHQKEWEENLQKGRAHFNHHLSLAQRFNRQAKAQDEKEGIITRSVFLYLGLEQVFMAMIKGLRPAYKKAGGLQELLGYCQSHYPSLYQQLPEPPQGASLFSVWNNLNLGAGFPLNETLSRADFDVLLDWSHALVTTAPSAMSAFLTLDSERIPILDPIQ